MMKQKSETIFSIFPVLFSLLFLNACEAVKGIVIDEVEKTGFKTFESDKNSKLEIYFFDSDNVVNETGEEFTRTGPSKNNADSSIWKIRAAESYLIKSGNVEILVDCGHQTGSYSHYDISNAFTNNVLKKIASVCDDGKLEYVLITHGDMDHIASFAVDNNVFDAFFSGKEQETIDGQKRKLVGIDNLIDFDSPMVALHSNKELENRLVNSELYQKYISARDSYLDKMNYLPVSALFGSSIKTSNGINQTTENKEIARPASLSQKNSDQLISENSGTENAMEYVDLYKKNNDYVNNVNALNGELKSANERFYYSIPFKNCELRILYNWFYDFGERHSFNSRDRNNISLCFEVVSGDFKFLSFGDLSGEGEKSILNYYSNTDMLENVSCFKASHHGSTNNGENSQNLFKTTKPKVVCAIGCAQCKLDNSGYDSSAAFIEQQFLNNLYNGLKNEDNDLAYTPTIFYTNVCCGKNDKATGIRVYESNPFYGDVKIDFRNSNIYVSSSYKGLVNAYISNEENIAFEKKHNGEYYNFTVRKNNSFVSFQNTDWFKRAGLFFGGK